MGKDGLLVEQWKALLRILTKGGSGDAFAQKIASLSLAKIIVAACPSKRSASDTRPVSYGSALEPMEALNSWIINHLKGSTGGAVGLCSAALMVASSLKGAAFCSCEEASLFFVTV